MCETCGCGQAGVAAGAGARGHEPGHGHHHGHEHDHAHHHGHGHALAPRGSLDGARRVELGRAVLAHNDAVAARNRRLLTERGVRMVDLVSSPGSGKTALLEATLGALSHLRRLAVLVGDVQTDNDASRLARAVDGRGVRVHQIETGGACHLDATDIERRLPALVDPGLDLLIVENVGNLVCPAAFDLGQHLRVALLSVTEGEDKPLKYPALFHRAAATVITKTDLVPHLRWDREACLANVRRVRPDARILEVSAHTGAGLDAFVELLAGPAGGHAP